MTLFSGIHRKIALKLMIDFWMLISGKSMKIAETLSSEESIDSSEDFSDKDGISVELSSSRGTKADAFDVNDELEVPTDEELFDTLGVNVRPVPVDKKEPDIFVSLGEGLTDDELFDMLQVNLKSMLTDKIEKASVEKSGEILTDAELLEMLGVHDGPKEILAMTQKDQSSPEKVCIASDQNDPIAQVVENIGVIMEHLIDVFIAAKSKGSMLVDISDPCFDNVIDKLGLANPCQIAYLDLIFDVSKEILVDLYQ
ncbi:uncharacterized protein [Parasteatoda tepidariorum]|uniref:uncharacterized protein n=1 Tax=Parasteatoda tepidariorum TaxID=114398 RepID=UPI0039BD8C3D